MVMLEALHNQITPSATAKAIGPGLGNRFQADTITVAGSEAVFHGDNGHSVTFHARAGSAGFLRTCS